MNREEAKEIIQEYQRVKEIVDRHSRLMGRVIGIGQLYGESLYVYHWEFQLEELKFDPDAPTVRIVWSDDDEQRHIVDFPTDWVWSNNAVELARAAAREYHQRKREEREAREEEKRIQAEREEYDHYLKLKEKYEKSV